MQKIILILTLIAFASLLPSNLGAYAFVADKPMQRVYNDASLNWAGYYVTGTGIGFVNATWTVPAVVNTVSGYSSVWAGIGGVNGDGLIQTGTEQDCSNGGSTSGEVRFHGPMIQDIPGKANHKGGGGGSKHCTPIYYAWWETYPVNAEQKITSMTISPGDQLHAVITQTNSGVWTMSLSDLTNAQSFSTTVTFSPDQTTAESIVERPALCSAHCKLTKLADFQTINFQESSSGITSASSIPFDSDPSHTIINMVDNSFKLMAQPGILSSPGAFQTTWIKSN